MREITTSHSASAPRNDEPYPTASRLSSLLVMARLVFAAALVLCLTQIGEARAACANNQTCGAKCCWEFSDGTLKITGSGAMNDYVGYSDSENTESKDGQTTAAPWGNYWKQITNIQIEEGITQIGRVAFNGLSKVKNVSIPASVSTIKHAAFDRMANLEEVNVAQGSKLKNIEKWAFAQAYKLNSVDSILNALANNQNASIGYRALASTGMITSITLPETITSLDEGGLSNPNLKEIVVPDTLTAEQVAKWDSKAFSFKEDNPNLTIRCLGDMTKCQTALGRFLPASSDCPATICKCNNSYCLNAIAIVASTETQCNDSGKYYYTGSTCDKIPTDLSKMTCNSGYVLDETTHRCDRHGCASFADGACTCDEGYYTKAGGCVSADEGCGDGWLKKEKTCIDENQGCGKYYYKKQNGCVSFEEGCGEGWLEKDSECIEASNGCGENYKDLGGWCNRVIYTPAEAAKVLNNDNTNFVTITFRK